MALSNEAREVSPQAQNACRQGTFSFGTRSSHCNSSVSLILSTREVRCIEHKCQIHVMDISEIKCNNSSSYLFIAKINLRLSSFLCRKLLFWLSKKCGKLEEYIIWIFHQFNCYSNCQFVGDSLVWKSCCDHRCVGLLSVSINSHPGFYYRASGSHLLS